MRRFFTYIAMTCLCAGIVAAQTTVRRAVSASGTATVSVTPDQAEIDLGVVTTATTASDAAAQNAAQTAAMISQVQMVLGTSGTIKTISYSLTPNYSYPNNQSPVLTGFTATNVIAVTTNNLALVGKIIDAGVSGGSNRVQSLQFTLQDDTTARTQALQLAAKKAQADAAAIATGLGLHTGGVIAANEGSTVTPIVVSPAPPPPSASTPIVVGNLTVTATVAIQVELTN